MASAPTITDFDARFPELVTSDTAERTWITGRISEAYTDLDSGTWSPDSKRQRGALLQAAHRFIIYKRSKVYKGVDVPMGAVTSVASDTHSKSYQAAGVQNLTGGDGYWMTTPYGHEFLELRCTLDVY